jgi:hypothetical protein
MGVGAAMAAGSHAEKGIWALLVKEASITRLSSNTKLGLYIYSNKKIFHDPQLNNHEILIKIATSPTRFDKIVNKPALSDFMFW